MYPSSVLVTSDTDTLPSLFVTIATDAVKSSVSIVDPAPVKAALSSVHPRAPLPSVFKIWFADPSAVGQESPSSCTAPLPFGAMAMFPFAPSVIVIEPVVELPV